MQIAGPWLAAAPGPFSMSAPLLGLLELAPVGEAGVVGFFAGPVLGHLGEQYARYRASGK
jgi:hypothetical protein